jgi:hypothetical protein
MTTIIAQAKHETGGWRGQIIGADGAVLTRTVNLYPDSDKAIAGAQRLWAFKQQQPAPMTPGGAA